jgi:hypothetical protein
MEFLAMFDHLTPVRPRISRTLARAFVLLWLPIFGALALASGGSASVSGKVSQNGSSPISGAELVLRRTSSGEVVTLKADAQGEYRFEGLTTGSYTLSAIAPGFQAATVAFSIAETERREVNLGLTLSSSTDTPASAISAEEIQKLKQQLADADRRAEEANQRLERLAAMVQELQARVGGQSPPSTPGQVANATAPVTIPSRTNQDQPKSQTPPPGQSSIDKLIKPKREGGYFSGADGLYRNDRIKIGGYADFRYVTRGLDDGNEIRSNADGANPGQTDVTNFKRNSFTTPRLVLAVAAEIAPKLVFNSEIEFEFAGKETEIEQMWLEYQLHPAFNIRGGVISAPLGRFNIFHDSNLQDIITRPLVSTFIIPSTYKDAGIGANGVFKLPRGMKLSYEGYVVNGLRSDEGGTIARESGIFETKGNNRFFDNNPQKSVVGRIVFSPTIGTEIGVSGYRGKHDNRGKYNLSVWAADFKFAKGGFQVVGEYARTALQRDPEGDAEIQARLFLLNLPRGRDYVNTFEFIDQNINVPLFDKPARSTDGFYVEARYRFRPNWLTRHFSEDASIAPVVRFDQINLDRQFPNFRFPLNQRRTTIGLSLRPTEAASINFSYHFNAKPDIFLRLPDGRPLPPYQTNINANGFSFGLAYAF